MAEDWAAVASDVSAALAEVGFAATLQRPSTGPATPWDATAVTPGATVAVTIMQDTYDLRHIDGALIRADDRRILMASDVVPTVADKLVIGSETLAIINVTPTAPGGTAVLYEVQARK